MITPSPKLGESLHRLLLMALASKPALTALLFLTAMSSNNVLYDREVKSDIHEELK